VARTIATITGTALRPGVSRNRRWYKPEHVSGAVQRAQERLAAGDKPMVMLSFHGAEDASREIAASLTGMRLAEDGSAEFEAGFTDTAAGWDIANLADTSDGKPAHLKNVSIRGFWTGKVRKERGPDGQMVETADGLEIEGVDWTKAPGVDGAEIKTFSWATGDGQQETTERVLITESVQEAAVTFTEAAEGAQEDAPAPPGSVLEAFRAILGGTGAHELDNGLCVTCAAVQESPTLAISKRKSGIAGTGGPYADPGYQADKKQRYQLDTKDHAVAAWRFINKASYAAKYSAQQLKRVKGRIRAALAKFGVKTSDEAALGWGFTEAVQVTPEVAEFYGDPDRAGSWCVSASNGPVNLSLSSYSMDPADLGVIVRAAAGAACDALKALDPDMDGDVDVPGAGDGSDTDGDAGRESAPEEDDPATETAPSDPGGENPAPAGPTESEGTPMPETAATSTEAGAGAPAGLTPEAVAKIVAESVAATFEARDAAKAAAKAAEKEAERKATEEAAAQKQALVGLLESVGIKVPAEGAPATPVTAPATEAAPATESTALTEADVEQRVNGAVAEALTEFKQALIGSGVIVPGRAGILVQEHAVPDADNAPDGEALRKMADDDLLGHLGGALVQAADTHRPVG
jgi:hypothetical protein